MSVSEILFGGGILLWSLRRSFSNSILNFFRSSVSMLDIEALRLSDLNHDIIIMITRWFCDKFLMWRKTLWLDETLLRTFELAAAFSSEITEGGSPNCERWCTMLSTLKMFTKIFHDWLITILVTFPWILTDVWIFQPWLDPLALIVHPHLKISVSIC